MGCLDSPTLRMSRSRRTVWLAVPPSETGFVYGEKIRTLQIEELNRRIDAVIRTKRIDVPQVACDRCKQNWYVHPEVGTCRGLKECPICGGGENGSLIQWDRSFD